MKQCWSLLTCNALCALSMASFITLLPLLATSLHMAPWQAGMLVTVSSLGLVGASLHAGSLSDRLGRSKVMKLSLSGLLLTHIMLWLFFYLPIHESMIRTAAIASVTALRFLQCIFYAAVPTVSYALACEMPSRKANAHLTICVAISIAIGNLLGPAMMAAIAPGTISQLFLLLCIFPAVALAVISLRCPRSPERQAPGISEMPTGCKDLSFPILMAFTAMCCASMVQVTIGFYVQSKMAIGLSEITQVTAVLVALAGAGVIIGQIVVAVTHQGLLAKARLGALLSSAGLLIAIMSDRLNALQFAVCITAMGIGMLLPITQIWASGKAGRNAQGKAAGYITSAQGLGYVIGPVLGTLLFQAEPKSPFIVSAILFIAISLALCLKRPGT